jgi:hypothetical protein
MTGRQSSMWLVRRPGRPVTLERRYEHPIGSCHIRAAFSLFGANHISVSFYTLYPITVVRKNCRPQATSFVFWCCCVHRIPPRVSDVANAPLCGNGMALMWI